MSSRLREHFGSAGLVVAIVALVAALGGGAYAATGGSSGGGKATASAKQGKPGKPGKTGPAGPAGAQGPAGANGKDGSNGANGSNGAAGSNGANGKTVLHGTTAPSSTTGTEGDFYIDTSSDEIFGPKGASTWPTPGTELKGEEGEEGSPWTMDGTLPSEATETGAWWFQGTETLEEYVPISFPIPLSVADAASITVLFTGDPEFAEKCPGTSLSPAAEPGFFCLYKRGISNIGSDPIVESLGGVAGVGPSGVTLFHENEPRTNFQGGGFAITAP
jgi:hypothetical protein